MAYGSCHNTGCASAGCGGRLDHNVSIYSSPDLTSGSWTYVSDLLPYGTRLSGTYYRPKVVQNPATKKWVFWVNVLPRATWNASVDFTKSSYLVATADAPQGPYSVKVQNASTKYGQGGDFSLFVDPDGGAGYLIYTSLAEAHSISIAPLTADFTHTVPAKNTAFLDGTNHTRCFEAPAMFKRDEVYYVMVSECSCFGIGGADACENDEFELKTRNFYQNQTKRRPFVFKMMNFADGCTLRSTRWARSLGAPTSAMLRSPSRTTCLRRRLRMVGRRTFGRATGGNRRPTARRHTTSSANPVAT